MPYSSLTCAPNKQSASIQRQLGDNLQVIILNTIIWSMSLTPKPQSKMDQEDPFGQFQWLRSQLESARIENNKVYVTGHIPPMLQSFTGSLGNPLYDIEKASRLWDLMVEYQDVIAGIFVAHVHSNELRHIPSFSGDAAPMFVGTSISPCYTTNPAFRIVKYSEETHAVEDMATFSVDLEKDVDTEKPFSRIVPSLTEFLGMESLTNKETLELATKLLPGGDEEVWDNYFNSWYKGPAQTQCDSAECQRGEACLMACGFNSDNWNSCNASSASIEISCGFVRSDTPTKCEENCDDDTSGGQTNCHPIFLSLLILYYFLPSLWLREFS